MPWGLRASKQGAFFAPCLRPPPVSRFQGPIPFFPEHFSERNAHIGTAKCLAPAVAAGKAPRGQARPLPLKPQGKGEKPGPGQPRPKEGTELAFPGGGPTVPGAPLPSGAGLTARPGPELFLAPHPMRNTSLKCGLLPGESEPVVRRLNEPLRAYLERQLAMPVELVVGKSYVATGEALRQGQLDLAYLGPVTYILQSRRAGLTPFARPTHPRTGPTFQAAIIVPENSEARTLADLKGKEVAFGDQASTSGTWVPRYQLLEAGLVAGRDYRRLALGAHDAVVQAVARRQVAAGGLSLPIYRRLIEEGRVEARETRILAESEAIPEYMWTFREGLPPHLREAIRQAFITLRDPAALAAYRAEAFIPAVDPDVDRVRSWMEVLLQARLSTSPLPWLPSEAVIGWSAKEEDARSATSPSPAP